jgi:ribonuclease P protein component
MAPELSGAIYFCKNLVIRKQLTLGKKERLKSRKQIEKVFAEGKVFNLSPFRVYYLFRSFAYPLQSGFAVGSRNFKKAVDRNRIKRLGRETYRVQKKNLQEALIKNNRSLAVFFIYTGKELPEFEMMHQKMDTILERLIKLINENNPVDS